MANRSRSALRAVVFALVAMASPALAVSEDEWEQLDQRAEQLFQDGKYAEGIAAAEQSIAAAEKAFGREHPNVAVILMKLGGFYWAQGQYAAAEPLYKRALSINEKAFGSEHLAVADCLDGLGAVYGAQRDYQAAEPLHKRALTIRERLLGIGDPAISRNLATLADFYRMQDRHASAEPLYERALAIDEKVFGKDSPPVGDSLQRLASSQLAQDKFDFAEPLFTRALLIREQAFGEQHPAVAQSLTSLAEIRRGKRDLPGAERYYLRAIAIYERDGGSGALSAAATIARLASLHRFQGQYTTAELWYRRALEIHEKLLGPEHLNVVESLQDLARVYRDQGEYEAAEVLFKRVLFIQERELHPDDPHVASSLTNLATIYLAQGRYASAESLFKRALAIQERLSMDNDELATTLNNLAEFHVSQGQYAAAEPLFERALAITGKSLGIESPEYAVTLNNFAMLYRDQGRPSQAQALLERSLTVMEEALGKNHPSIAGILSNLAQLQRESGQFRAAEALQHRALEITEKTVGSEHPDFATGLGNLAVLYEQSGQRSAAEALYKRALAIQEKALGENHPQLAGNLRNLSLTYLERGESEAAAPLAKRALAIWEETLPADHPLVGKGLATLAIALGGQKRVSESLLYSRRATAVVRKRVADAGLNEAATREASSGRDVLGLLLLLLSINPDNAASLALADESLQVVQVLQSTGAASAVAKMAVRFASGSGELATLVRRRQDLAEERVRRDRRLVDALGQPPEKRSTERERRVRERLAEIDNELVTVDAGLGKKFPAYQELTQPQPLALAELQKLLRPDEAMLVFAIGEPVSFAWVITPAHASFRSLDVQTKVLAEQVARIRSQMEFDPAGQLPAVSVDMLHQLHQALVAPIELELKGAKHLLVVPAGPLQSLPLGMLVASPAPTIRIDADYREVDWLAKRFAISVLPSVSSIRAFRQFAKPGRGQEPFAGFGDPLIGEGAGPKRGKSNLAVNTVFRGKVKERAGRLADIEAIRAQARLPETADELRVMAKTLKASDSSLWLQDRATETKLKQADLSRYRTVAFATHGLVAGEIEGLVEPGLILTPPKEATSLDDGYLSASEVARLNLNADWVVLSACNTASADGGTGAEGLSGLARAFFYAGARSLLVSHWLVDSGATVPLTTTMLKLYEADPTLGKAEAHRRSMLELMNHPDRPEYAHPAFWAPFVVVGEGGWVEMTTIDLP